MALINFARKEVEAKIVYYGPAFSGKTTNVQVLHGLVPAQQRGELHSLSTAEDRTLFFDYVPLQIGQIAGFTAKFKLFTVPGQVFYKETRRVVLQGADAVVFVADSNPDRADANIDSLVDLEENLRSHGLDLSSIPLVIQLNKRDAPNARSATEMGTDLNPFGVPLIEAVAFEGKGVAETLKAVTDIAAARIRDNLAGRQTAVQLTAIERPQAEDDRKVIREHLEKIKKVRPFEEEQGELLKASGQLKASDVDAYLLANVERAQEYLAKNATSARPIGGGMMPAPTHNAPVPAQPAPAGQSPAQSAAAIAQKAGPVTGSRSAPIPAPPPPPAAPAHEVQFTRPALPAGQPLEAGIDTALIAGTRCREVQNARVDGGRVVMDLVLEKGGETRLHPVMLVARAQGRPAPEPANDQPNWMLLGSAAMLGAAIGVIVGIIVGAVVF